MFASVTPQQIIDGANAATDNDGYSLVSDQQFVDWINGELTELWGWAPLINRDVFTKVSSTFQLASGAQEISMTAAAPTGVGVTDWMSPRGVDCYANGAWSPMKQWSFSGRFDGRFAFRFAGDIIHVEPAEYAASFPLRVWYLHAAPQCSTSSLATAMSIPMGAKAIIEQGVAAKVRARLDDDPSPHLQSKASAVSALRDLLINAEAGQDVVAETCDWDM